MVITSIAVCRTALLRQSTRQVYGSQHGIGYGTFGETFSNTMFNQTNPVIVQIRRELRGQLPDEWLEEVISILEYQLTYQTLDELATNDLLKLRLGASLSPALHHLLSEAITPASQSVDGSIAPPQTFRLPWQ
ncbi:MAG: hypothetical protein KME27_30365 [Lyngbya sp. HA4199-MV5]|nr:hypothetical protein [Lyngbya sp. HA4199-MV5]